MHEATEDHRSSGPLLTRLEWHEALLTAGFEGLNISLPDNVEESHCLSLLASCSASSPEFLNIKTETGTSTIITTQTPQQEDIASRLCEHLTKQYTGVCDTVSFDSIPTTGFKYDQWICLMELGQPIMAHLTEVHFNAIRYVVDFSNQVIWITNNCGEDAENPEAAMISGFGRSITRERSKLSFVHLNVQSGDSAIMTQSIVRVVDQSRQVPPHQQERELLEEDGVISVPRVVEAPHINTLFDLEAHGSKLRPVEVEQGVEGKGEALELRFTPGRLDSFHFGPDFLGSALQEDQILVLVKATGINSKDVMVALNQTSDDHIGQEFAGVVVEAGREWKTTFRPGESVCGIAAGSFRTSVRTRGSHIMKIPPGVSFTEASAIPIAYATAQYGLHHLARLQSGESILIHAAAGAVGQAAIRLAQRAGAEIYVTVSTPEKKGLLVDRFGIEPTHIFSSRHTFFANQIMQKTDGKGVDIVLNSLSGPALTESWRCLAAFGRFIEIGKRDMSTFQNSPMEPFLRNVSFCSLDLTVVMERNEKLTGRIMQEVQALLSDEETLRYMAPFPLTVFK